MKRYCLVLSCMVLALLAGCYRQKTFQKTEPIMGTDVTITVVAKTAAEGEAAIDAGMAEVKRLDAMMSLYKDDSELTKVNLAAGVRPVRVSPEMIEMTEDAIHVSKLTGGAFDPTIGPLEVLWQMRLKDGAVPTEEEIARVRSLVDYRDVVVDRKRSTIYLKQRGMILDFGGCAKGFAADRVRDLFRKRGVDNAIIALAGDIWALGRREDGKPWRIGVQDPREKDRTLTVLDLSDQYISTSGDYERFVIRGNKRYPHILDPRTGRPSTGTESVTVIGEKGDKEDKGALIDPLTTTLFILGPKEGMQLVGKLGVQALFVDDHGRETATSGIRLGS